MSVANNADDYANGRISIFFPGFPSSLTGQCVSLAKWFLGEMCGVSDWQAARGNAKDFGDTLVNQGHATVVTSPIRGDLAVWKQDGGGYGHIGVVLSGSRVFEENVGLKGTPSEVVGGVTVYASRIDPLSASWRVGAPTFYRVNSYHEVNPNPNATQAEIEQAYQDILERPADAGGLSHYSTHTLAFVRADLLNSAEYRQLQANKAAAAQAAEQAAQAKAIADAVAAQQIAQQEADAKAAAEQAQQAPPVDTTPVATPTITSPTETPLPPATTPIGKPNFLQQILNLIVTILKAIAGVK